MNADWTSAGNESRKKKKAPSLLCDSITSENFYSLGDLFIRSWWIQFVRKCKGQWWHPCNAAVMWGHSGGREPGGHREVKVLPDKVTQGTQAEGKDWGSGEPGHAEQKSGGKQRGVGRAGGGGSWPEKQRGGEETWEWNCKGCCHFLMLILISRMQSLVKILSDLCQILLQIKT